MWRMAVADFRDMSGGAGYAPLNLREQVQAEKARRSLYEFSKQAWHVLEPSTPYSAGWHLEAISEHLEACSRGQIRNLIINIPPRHSKSLLTAVFWNAWAWIHHPESRWLCSSYALSLSIRDSRKCKIVVESDWYQRRWGNIVSLSKDQKGRGRFENTAQGYRLAVSTESSATGEGGDVILVDDAISARDGNSQNRREDTILWWDTTMATRLNDPKTGIKVIVMQRLHQEDLTGHALEIGGYTCLMLPAEYEPQRKCFTDIGWQDPRTVEGELLWPAQMPQRELDKMKRAMGPTAYAAQYQQSPVPGGGAIFKQEWFSYFSQEEKFYALHGRHGDKRVLKSECWKMATVDLAVSKTTTADYTVIATWAVTPDNDLLLLELIRERFDGPEIESAIKNSYYRHWHTFIVIETTAFQIVMLQGLVQQGVPCQGFSPHKDKVSRAISASTFYANGKVYHERFAEYLTDLEKEMLMFPKGAHDDCVDAISMASEACFNPMQANIRDLDDDYTPEENLLKTMEKRREDDWGDF